MLCRGLGRVQASQVKDKVHVQWRRKSALEKQGSGKVMD